MNKEDNTTKEQLLLKIKQLESQVSELQESKRESQNWLENSPVCTKIIDLDFNLQYMSTAGVDALKIKNINDYYGKPYPIHFFNDDIKGLIKSKLLEAKNSNKTVTLEAPLQDINGDSNWFHNSFVQIYNKQNKIDYLLVVSVDINDRKIAETKLLESRERFDLAMNVSKDGIYDWNLVNNDIYYSPAWKKLLGYEDHELANDFSVWEKLTPKKDIERSWKVQQALINKKIDRFEVEFQMKHKDGHWVDILSRAEAIFDANGKAIRMVGTHVDITESKGVEQEVIQTKQFYENILEAVQDGIWVTNENDIIYYANEATSAIAGVPKKDIVGKYIFTDFPVETNGDLISYYQTAKEEKIAVWYELKIETLGKRESYQNGWLIPLYQDNKYSGIICTIRDITKRRHAEVDVIKLSTAVEQSPSIIAITDIKGNLEYVNPQFTETTGYSNIEAIGKNPRILKSGNHSVAFYKELWKTANSGKVWRGQFQNRNKNGQLFWESASISAIYNKSGKITNYIKIGEDITQQKQTEIDLKEALDKALQSDKLKTAFLANMSHEIRTPMNGILGFVNLLSDPSLSSSKVQEYSSIISKSSKRLLSTINDIIDISKIEAGEMHILRNEVSVNNMLDELLKFHKVEAEDKGLKLISKPELGNHESVIITDCVKLHGILTNLIKNAIKYTKYGIITFGYTLKNDFIEFFCDDTGIGIPENRIHAIFNRFEQADIEDVMVYEGSGLGLAISKAYTEILGGQICVESVQFKGSNFKFTIPFEPVYEIIEKPKVELIEKENSNLSNLNLLIVEDDEVSAEFLQTILESDFNNIYFAVNGIEAVQKCKDMAELDLILMDVKMPKMGGYEATREIREFNKDIIIIAQTAYAMQGDMEKALDAGCNEYITKPVNQKALNKLINKLFS